MQIIDHVGPYTIRTERGMRGVEIYREGLTHATRCATIGYRDHGQAMRAAYAEIQRRLECPKEQERVRFA